MPHAPKAQDYFQEWYDDNRDDLNERRRARYAADPEYRKKVQKWNQDARARRRKEAAREDREAKRAVKIKTAGAWKTVEVEVDGVMVRMFTIGALARAIGKGISTIRVWERNGTLPETPYRSKKGDRLYTLEMVESIQKALRQAGKLDIGVLKEKKRPAYVEKSVRFKGKRKPEYILSESQMHKRMISRGLEGTELVVRDATSPQKISDKKLAPKGLANLVKLLADAERIVGVLARRGIKFTDFVEKYYDGKRLPRFRIRVEGVAEMYYDRAEYAKRFDELEARSGAQAEDEELIVTEELHEVARIMQIDERLQAEYGLDLKDFLLKPAKTDSGETAPTKFQLISGDDRYEIPSLGEICSSVRQIGGKGTDIKRFKGLGEMNAEQLWDTTMNPATRTLLRVKLDDAGEADRLFSILMGENVEQRRTFIRDHALEVQNLDI